MAASSNPDCFLTVTGRSRGWLQASLASRRKIGGGRQDVEEFLLVDSSGRVQIPREMLDSLKIRRLVQMDVVDGQVRIRPSDVSGESPDDGGEQDPGRGAGKSGTS